MTDLLYYLGLFSGIGIGWFGYMMYLDIKKSINRNKTRRHEP